MKTGICALCGESRPLTFEHIPPQCAFNNKLIFVQKHDHLVSEGSPLFGKKMRSQRGFGKQSLCAACNNSTGNWYVKDFCDFVNQGWKILEGNTNPGYVQGEYIIKPQNVLKQILVMFLSADSSGALRDIPGVKEYLLNKDCCDFPPDIRIFLYSNASPQKRLLGYMVVGDLNYEPSINHWSEINFRPFGYFLTYNSPPPNEFMVDITNMSKVPFNKQMAVTLTLAYLVVDTPLIGFYKNVPG